MYYMPVLCKWNQKVRVIKNIKYAPHFISGVGRILFLRQNVEKKGGGLPGNCDTAIVVGHGIRKTSDTLHLFIDEWGCGKYLYGYHIRLVLKFPNFHFSMNSCKSGSVPGLLVDKVDLQKCIDAIAACIRKCDVRVPIPTH